MIENAALIHIYRGLYQILSEPHITACRHSANGDISRDHIRHYVVSRMSSAVTCEAIKFQGSVEHCSFSVIRDVIDYAEHIIRISLDTAAPCSLPKMCDRSRKSLHWIFLDAPIRNQHLCILPFAQTHISLSNSTILCRPRCFNCCDGKRPFLAVMYLLSWQQELCQALCQPTRWAFPLLIISMQVSYIIIRISRCPRGIWQQAKGNRCSIEFHY